MKKHIWKSGPPPSIGWWPASYNKNWEVIRWWNGAVWSMPAAPSESAKSAAKSAAIESPYTKSMQWCARWWE